MKPLLVAVQFLTRLPIRLVKVTEREVGRSVLWFPMVGVLIGAVLLGSYLFLSLVFPLVMSRVLALVILIVISGAFHLDGLADTVDALYGGRDREDALRIMKDPHIGTMGVVAIVMVLFLKAATALTLPEALFRGALVVMPIVGRSAMVVALALPTARSSGLGKAFADHRSPLDVVVGGLLMVAAAFSILKFTGLGALLGGVAAAGALLFLVLRKIGGVTGDVCGAVNEVTETAFLLALNALAPISLAALERFLPEAFWGWHL